VSRPVAHGGRNLVGGNSWIVVDAPVAEVWRALSSPNRYARIWPTVERVRVLSRSPNQAVVHVRQRAGLATPEFVLRLDFKEGSREVDFRVSRSGDVRAGWGFFRLEPQGARTLVAYGAVIDRASGFVRALFEDRLRRRLLDMPTGVKRYVERQYRASRGHSG
jgi:carbon monoxide dehydrogenase subunit G